MATVVKCFAIQGVDGYVVDAETKILDGQPMISIIGMGDQAVKEAGERIQSAIDESGYVFPKKRVVISLAPGDTKKRGSHYDLAMAIGVLMESDDVAIKGIQAYGFIGELSLDGRLRACRGILPMIIAAKKAGIRNMIVPEDNLQEAKLVKGITAMGFPNLTNVIRYLEGKEQAPHYVVEEKTIQDEGKRLDFADVKGQDEIIDPVSFFRMDEAQKVRTSAELKEKVKAARTMQQKRYTGEDGVNCNAQMNTALIQRYCQMDKDTTDLLKETCEKYGYSARVIHKLLRLARTSADLDNSEQIRFTDIEKVLSCRDLDRSNSKMMVVK